MTIKKFYYYIYFLQNWVTGMKQPNEIIFLNKNQQDYRLIGLRVKKKPETTNSSSKLLK